MNQTAAIQLLEHFGLKVAPFETAPDPRVFLPTPAHSEALALVEYAVHAGKGCAAIAGPSGSGKTLLARMAFRECIRRQHDVLWVDSIGQPADATEATRYSPRLVTAGGGPGREETTLEEWARSERNARSLVIVDDADALARRGWTDLISLMTRDARAFHPATILILGLPVLLKRLAEPSMLRIRRRMFRALRLDPLDDEWVRRYLEHRITDAGGDVGALFTDAAIDAVAALTGGNPGLINQLCESALVNAFGDGDDRIDVQHVEAAGDATLLSIRDDASTTDNSAPAPVFVASPPSVDSEPAPRATDPVADPAAQASPVPGSMQSADSEPDTATSIAASAEPARTPGAAAPHASETAAQPAPVTEDQPEALNHLDALEARVMRVLSAVQEVVSVMGDDAPETATPSRLSAHLLPASA